MANIDALATATTGLLAAGGGTVIAQLVQAWRHRGQDGAAKDAGIVGAAKEVVDILRTELREQEMRHRDEMGRLRAQLAEAQGQAAAARAEAGAAQAEITELRRALAAAGSAPA